MMSELFDEEYLRKRYDAARFREGIVEVALKMLRSGFASKEDIAELTGLSIDKINELATATF